MGGYNGMGGFGWGFGGPLMILVWVLLIVGIIALVKWLVTGTRGAPPAAGRSALEILQERYARGEIDREEYRQKREDLEHKP